MSNSIAPGSSADVNVKVTALTTNPNVPVTYKTIILKKNLVNGVNTLTQEMMSVANTKYVIKYDYVLDDDINVPAECILEFDGGSFSGNKILTCNNTFIKATSPSLNGVTLSGSYANSEIESGIWFDEDIENGLNQLINNFNIVNISKDYTLSRSLFATLRKNVIINGQNHTLFFTDINDYGCIYLHDMDYVEINNLCIDFSLFINTTYDDTLISAINLSLIKDSHVNNVSIKNFNSRNFTEAKSFNGINVNGLHKFFKTEINDVNISDILVLGDAQQGSSVGCNYGIVVQYARQDCGTAYIHNVSMKNMINIDVNGDEIEDDTSGIYINASYTASNIQYYGNLQALIEDCVFTDVAKRLIKAQSDNITVRNIEAIRTKAVHCYAFIETYGKNAIIDNCKGMYNGQFLSNKEYAVNTVLSNINVDSNFESAFVGAVHSYIYNTVEGATISICNANITTEDFYTGGKSVLLDVENADIVCTDTLFDIPGTTSFTDGSVHFNLCNITTNAYKRGGAFACPFFISDSIFNISEKFVAESTAEIRNCKITIAGNDANGFIFSGDVLMENVSIIDNGSTSRKTGILLYGRQNTIRNIMYTLSREQELERAPYEVSASVKTAIFENISYNKTNKMIINRAAKTVVLRNSENVVIEGRSSGNLVVYSTRCVNITSPNGSAHLDITNGAAGTFEQKPSAANIYIGFAYFCTDKQTIEGTTDGIMIYHKGSDVWIDALGRVVS